MQVRFPTARLVATGLTWPECPRWHEGSLYVSDMHAGRVCRISEDGGLEEAARLPSLHDPAVLAGGLGFTRNGDLLAVSIRDRVIYRLGDAHHHARPSSAGPSRAEIFSDLRTVALSYVNDMLVRDDDTAFVSQFGYDIFSREPHRAAPLLQVSENGDASEATTLGLFEGANGMTETGTRLYVAETFAGRIAQVGGVDGPSTPVRDVFVETPPFPDGICSDREGAVWVGLPESGRVQRYDQDGTLTHDVRTPSEAGRPVACVLSEDENALYICCGWHPLNYVKAQARRNGSIWRVDL